MQLKYLNKLAKRLKTDHIQMNPSSDAQFRTLHLLSNSRKLPEAYLEFMRIMGNGAKGDFLKGDSCFMDEIEDLKQGAEELLEENQSKQKLKEEDFVFWMSQGCMFCFFRLNDGNNPPVYFYNETGEDRFIKIAHSLTEFFSNRYACSRELFKEK